MFFFLLSGSSTLLTRKSWNRFSHRWPNHTACRTGLHNTSNTHKVTWHKKKFVCYTNIFQILELASHIYWFSVINLILKANCFLFIFSILLNSDFYTRRRNYTNGSENIIFSCKKKMFSSEIVVCYLKPRHIFWFSLSLYLTLLLKWKIFLKYICRVSNNLTFYSHIQL